MPESIQPEPEYESILLLVTGRCLTRDKKVGVTCFVIDEQDLERGVLPAKPVERVYACKGAFRTMRPGQVQRFPQRKGTSSITVDQQRWVGWWPNESDVIH